MGLQIFSVCSILAIMLLAVNATGENGLTGMLGLSMANIEVCFLGLFFSHLEP